MASIVRLHRSHKLDAAYCDRCHT